MTKVILVEDEWVAQSIVPLIEGEIGPVSLKTSFGALKLAIEELSQRAGTFPVVLLDPGLPDVCRLVAVYELHRFDSRVRIVTWTQGQDTSFLASTLLDGASAAVSKSHPISLLAEVVERVANNRYSCEPNQAQWMFDFLGYLERCRLIWLDGGGGHIWSNTQMNTIGERLEESWFHNLNEIASGGSLGSDDRWFREMIAFLRRYWLEPHLRKTLVALAVSGSRKGAAALVDRKVRTVHGYCGKIVPRLYPHAYPSEGEDDRGTTRLARWAITNHAGCALPIDRHSFEISA